MADNSLKSWEDDPNLYLFTSLTAGSSHIITATTRIETILKSARIPFTYIDTATNESAKRLFQRRARGKKLPLLVKDGFVIADYEEVEEWSEFGELEENIGEVATTATSITTTPAKMGPPSLAPSAQGTPSKSEASVAPKNAVPAGAVSQNPLMKQLAAESAAAAKAKKEGPPVPAGLKDMGGAGAAASATASINVATAAVPPDEVKSPLSPSSIPLPMSPAPTTTTATKPAPAPDSASPPHSPSHYQPRRRSSTGSVTHDHSSHQFVPDRFDPPPVIHRGSNLSTASGDEIRQIERAEAIEEVDEEAVDDSRSGVGVEVKKGEEKRNEGDSDDDEDEDEDEEEDESESEDEDEDEEEDESEDEDEDEEEEGEDKNGDEVDTLGDTNAKLAEVKLGNDTKTNPQSPPTQEPQLPKDADKASNSVKG